MNARWRRLPWWLGLPLLGCWGCGGGSYESRIAAPQISQPQVGSLGGTVTLSATIWHPLGIAEAWAEVLDPAGQIQRVSLNHVGGDRYEGALTLPSNLVEGPALVYRVRVRARSAEGNVTPSPGVPEAGVTVEVKPITRPPDAPRSAGSRA
jgi:hypothetical protein